MKWNEAKSGRTVCFGELLVRLSSPAGQMLLQSPGLEVCVGGAEANVAASLAQYGRAVGMVSALPENALGRGARDRLRAYGVDTGAIVFRPGRMGLYFLTPGAVLRPSEIIYDRAGSVFAQAEPGLFDWPALLAGAGWLHVSGVSPAIGPQAAQAVLAAVRAARAMGVRVAFDGNYRASMWTLQGNDGAEVLFELMANADLAFADQRDIALVLKQPALAHADRRDEAAQAAFAAFPHLGALAATVRTQHSVDRHTMAATLHTREGAIGTKGRDISGIVDRIGGGDAFAAGFLHGVQGGWTQTATLEFALAAAVMKHSIAGDVNLATEAQVRSAWEGSLDVRR